MKLVPIITLALALPMTARPLIQPKGSSMETEAETIAKCLEDLKSPQVEQRRRAALVIGKYTTPQAQQALLACLQDPDRDVRQSALVSLTEGNTLPQAAKPWIFRLLKDSDVHIRRLASSLLPDAIGVSMTNVSFSPNVRIKASGNRTPEENQEALACMEAALADSDLSVRRNVLRASRFFPGSFSAQALEPFFDNEDNELRCLALLAYESAHVDGATRSEKISRLVKDPFPQVRLILVSLATVCGNDGLPLLRQLMEDGDSNVRLEAIKQYVQTLQPDSLPVLQQALFNPTIPEKQRALLVHLLLYFKENAEPILTKLLDDPSPAIQAEALRLMASGRNGNLSVDFCLRKLSSDNADVRRQCLLTIQRQLMNPSPEQIKQLVSQPYSDVRLAAIQSLLPRLKDKQAMEPFLLDACTDDFPAVRASAVRQVVMRRITGWEEILAAAAEDEAQEVRSIAERFKRIPSMSPNQNRTLPRTPSIPKE